MSSSLPAPGEPVGEAALERAWRTYLMMHRNVEDDDPRRGTLRSYIGKLCAAGEDNPEGLAVAGLRYLKQLDLMAAQR